MERTVEAVHRRELLKAGTPGHAAGLTFPEAPAGFIAGRLRRRHSPTRAGPRHQHRGLADPDIRSLQHAVLYGLKGVAAYCFHAAELGFSDAAVDEYLVEALTKPCPLRAGRPEATGSPSTLRCGEINYRTMALLDKANTESFGVPVPTEVPLGVKAGKAILVSGHDMADLKALLEQTEGKGITVYTHGEMLPAHAYPKLKAHAHLYGNFGGAWYNQKKDFPRFPGPVLMTSNCIQIPEDSYSDEPLCPVHRGRARRHPPRRTATSRRSSSAPWPYRASPPTCPARRSRWASCVERCWPRRTRS